MNIDDSLPLLAGSVTLLGGALVYLVRPEWLVRVFRAGVKSIESASTSFWPQAGAPAELGPLDTSGIIPWGSSVNSN